MSDTWNEIQAEKNKQLSMREKLAMRRKEREQVVADVKSIANLRTASASTENLVPTVLLPASTSLSLPSVSQTTVGTLTALAPATKITETNVKQLDIVTVTKPEPARVSAELLMQAELKLLALLSDVTIDLPADVSVLAASVSKSLSSEIPLLVVEDLLHKLSFQKLVSLEAKGNTKENESQWLITFIDFDKVAAVEELENEKAGITKRKISESGDGEKKSKIAKKSESSQQLDLVENLLSKPSAKESEKGKVNEEILNILSKPTVKELSLVEKFKSQGTQMREFCQYGTKEECTKVNSGSKTTCDKLHFRKIINQHTDESLGDCSFLNTCFHMETCKYVHYTVDYPPPSVGLQPKSDARKSGADGQTTLFPQQWVNCDLRTFDMTVLGKFTVVMADPPWDIHMELPYGTMGDDEMRNLNVRALQDDGYLFLWVTGRAMELGRECLKLWGYEQVDEIIWVKTNQLQRIIRTGRTGHWLNHGKEHCLVGLKGNPQNINRGLDCDVIVAEVRETSHKPDEIYGIIERLAPGSRKVELFGRPHNVQPNWITLGNQLDGVKLLDPVVVKAFKERYPDHDCTKPVPRKT